MALINCTNISAALLTIFLAGFVVQAQKIDKKAPKLVLEAERIKLAQRSAVDNFDVEIQRVQFTAIRNNIRYLLAGWLWDEGQDEEYAIEIAEKAFEETVEKDDEGAYKCESDTCISIWVLIETYSPNLRKKLAEKYRLGKRVGLGSVYADFMNKGSAKSAVDKLVSMLGEPETQDAIELEFIVEELAARNSPELPRLLDALLTLDDRDALSANDLFKFVDAFRKSIVPQTMRERFYRSVIRKGYAALSADDPAASAAAYQLLFAISGDLSDGDSILRPQVEYLKTVLKGNSDRRARENDEVYQRILKATDKLTATISEAEAASGKNLKEDLYSQAIRLAIRARKDQLALDLIEKLVEVRRTRDTDGSFNRRFITQYDQFHAEITLSALRNKNFEISAKATERIEEVFKRAEMLKQAALILFDNKESNEASNRLKEAVKIINASEDNARKLNTLLKLVPAFQKIDKTELFNLTLSVSKAIEVLSPPDEKATAESEVYKNYERSVVETSANLISALEALLKSNRMEAFDLANRINKKEFKIAADYTVLRNKLEELRKKPAVTPVMPAR